MRRFGWLLIVLGVAALSILLAHRNSPIVIGMPSPVASHLSGGKANSEERSSKDDSRKVLSVSSATRAQLDFHTRFETSNDLYGLFQELHGLADANDPQAIVALADIEDECRAFVLSGGIDGRMTIPELAAKKKPVDRGFVDGLRQRTQSRCGRFNKSDFPTSEQERESLKLAAKNGSMAAQAELLSSLGPSSKDIPDEAFADSVHQILSSGEADAIFRLSGAMLIDGREKVLDVPSGSPVAAAAYEIAACRLGVDCGTNSRILANVCFNTGSCGEYSSYEAYLTANELTPIQAQALNQYVALILSKVRTHH